MKQPTLFERDSGSALERFASNVYVKILFVILAVLIVSLVVNYPPGWDFRNNLWGPARLLVNGESPYRIDLLFDNSNAVWMPPIIGVFFPIGWLTLQQANNFWWALNLIAMLAVIWFSTGESRPKPIRLMLVSVLCFVFPPLIGHFGLGQVSILICLIFLIVTGYADRLKGLPLAFLLVVALAKPQLGLFVIPGYMLMYLKERGMKQTLRLVGLIILSAAVLTIPLFAAFPGWAADFIHNLQSNPPWAHPSLLFWLSVKLGVVGVALWAVLLAAGMGLNLKFWLNRPKDEAVIYSLALTPLLVPYIWTWDFVLIVPLLIRFAFRKQPAWVLLLFGIGYLICAGSIARSKLSAELSEAYFWWVPWVLVGLVILGNLAVATLDKRQAD